MGRGGGYVVAYSLFLSPFWFLSFHEVWHGAFVFCEIFFCYIRELISGNPLFQAFSSFSALYVSSPKSDIQIKIKRIKARGSEL